VDYPQATSEARPADKPLTDKKIEQTVKAVGKLLSTKKSESTSSPKAQSKLLETPLGSSMYGHIKKNNPSLTDQDIDDWIGLI
jgi:hypothetical protein